MQKSSLQLPDIVDDEELMYYRVHVYHKLGGILEDGVSRQNCQILLLINKKMTDQGHEIWKKIPSQISNSGNVYHAECIHNDSVLTGIFESSYETLHIIDTVVDKILNYSVNGDFIIK
jgi:hypothetical protein